MCYKMNYIASDHQLTLFFPVTFTGTRKLRRQSASEDDKDGKEETGIKSRFIHKKCLSCIAAQTAIQLKTHNKILKS